MVNPQKLLGNQPVVFSGNHLEVNEDSKIVGCLESDLLGTTLAQLQFLIYLMQSC